MSATVRGPVFVAGLERSGTSLMFALLASHPNIAMTRRTNLWTHFYGQYGDLAQPENLERCLRTMQRYRRLAILGIDWDVLQVDFAAGERTYPRLFALLEEQCARAAGKPRWGDKSLHTERYAEQILAAYPGARILHMLRDPRDRYASSKTRWGVRRGGVGAGTAEWLASARIALRNQLGYRDAYRVVRYEDLVAAPEDTMRAVCDFLGEPYAPVMLSMREGGRFAAKGGNSSYGARASGSISADSVGRFRTVLSPRQITVTERFARREMELFGYAPDHPRLGAAARARLRAADVPIETARLLAWRLREWRRDRRGRPVPAYRLLTVEGAR